MSCLGRGRRGQAGSRPSGGVEGRQNESPRGVQRTNRRRAHRRTRWEGGTAGKGLLGHIELGG
jgi:hypothetical protein